MAFGMTSLFLSLVCDIIVSQATHCRECLLIMSGVVPHTAGLCLSSEGYLRKRDPRMLGKRQIE